MQTPDVTIVAIDPGLTGALAWLRLREGVVHLLAVEDVPTAKAQQGKSMKAHLLIPALADMMQNPLFDVQSAVIEEVHAMPGQGVTSMFRFGYTAGAIAGVCAGLRLPTHFVRPQAWQKVAGVRKGDDAGRLRAVQLFPKKARYFSRKMDHNRADAALIGYAHLCQLSGGTVFPTD